jgi:hypothetical protein
MGLHLPVENVKDFDLESGRELIKNLQNSDHINTILRIEKLVSNVDFVGITTIQRKELLNRLNVENIVDRIQSGARSNARCMKAGDVEIQRNGVQYVVTTKLQREQEYQNGLISKQLMSSMRIVLKAMK